MVTWETLRELAGFRAQRGVALSLYANLDPRLAPTTGEMDQRLNALLDEAGRLLAEEKKQRADVERARAWLDGEFDRDGVRGIALFVAGPDDVFLYLKIVV